MKQIIMPLYSRTDYIQATLDALAKCDGIKDYHVLFSHDWDGAHPDQIGVVAGIVSKWMQAGYAESEYILHTPKLGIDGNKLWAFPRSFRCADYAILLEDDIIPSKQFLRFHEWASAKFRHDGEVLAVSAYSKQPASENYRLDSACLVSGFNAWGMGIWENRWDRFFADQQYEIYAGKQVNDLFDRYLKEMGEKHNLKLAQPVVARCQNVGRRNGVHTIPEDFDGTDRNDHGAWEVEDNTTEWKI
jgi:hypothetical protein